MKTAYVRGYKSINDLKVLGDWVYFCGTKTLNGVDKGFITRINISTLFNNAAIGLPLDYVYDPTTSDLGKIREHLLKASHYQAVIISEVTAINHLAIYEDAAGTNVVGVGLNQSNVDHIVRFVVQPQIVGNLFRTGNCITSANYDIAALPSDSITSLIVTDNYIATVGDNNDTDTDYSFVVRKFPKTNLNLNVAKNYIITNSLMYNSSAFHRLSLANTEEDNIVVHIDYYDPGLMLPNPPPYYPDFELFYRIDLATSDMQSLVPLRMTRVQNFISELVSDHNGTLFATKGPSILRINNINANPTQAILYDQFDHHVNDIDFSDGVIQSLGYATWYPNYPADCNPNIYVDRKDINRNPTASDACWTDSTLPILTYTLPTISNLDPVTFSTNTPSLYPTPLHDTTTLTPSLSCIAYEQASKSAMQQLADEISLYPNPAHNNIEIVSPNEINMIEIYNVMGQKVYQIAVGSVKTNIDISALKKGNYIVKIYTNEEAISKKLIVN
ncbi:MAG: T9SS type A sorting domain-containing protein [Bacteroidales bacterium]|nr:T9SS type A sorting domain-containing protein [Bacteroidales bacterium]